MTWPAGEGISKYPRLRGSDNQRAAFMAYTAAFTAGEFETLPKFYSEDVTLKLPTFGPLKGPKEIMAFYSKMFVKIRASGKVSLR